MGFNSAFKGLTFLLLVQIFKKQGKSKHFSDSERLVPQYTVHPHYHAATT